MESLYFSFSFGGFWVFCLHPEHSTVLWRLIPGERLAVYVFPHPHMWEECILHGAFRIVFSFVFQQFECNMVRCGSHCAYPSWNSVELYGYPEYCFYFYQTWGFLGHYFFKYSFPPLVPTHHIYRYQRGIGFRTLPSATKIYRCSSPLIKNHTPFHIPLCTSNGLLFRICNTMQTLSK